MHRSAAVIAFVASLALAGSSTSLLAQSAAPAAAPAAAEEMLIDFESLGDARRLPGRLLGERYLESRGARFGAGAHGVLCGSTSEAEVAATGVFPPCAYPAGASGNRAGYFDGSTEALVIDFDRPIRSLSIRANLPTVHSGQTYRIRIEASNSNGFVAQSEIGGTGSVDLAPQWPTTASVSGDAPFTQVRVRALYDGTGQFLFDDIHFQPAISAVLADILTGATVPNVDEAAPVSRPAAQAGLRRFQPAQRVRTRVEWDAAFSAAAQLPAGVLAAGAMNAVNRASLPVLLPGSATALSVVSGGDSYVATISSGGRDFTLFGTRVMSVLSGGGPPDTAAIDYADLEYGVAASFSVYGASYALTMMCAPGQSEAACRDRAPLEAALKSLVVVIGEAGRARP